MKKILLGLVAAAALLATSCDKNLQEGPVAADGTAKVSVNLKFPEIQTRAYSDGTTATQLQYAVYEKTSGGLVLIDALTHSIVKGNAETINISKQVDFQLVTGRTYTFVFWAGAPSDGDWISPYTVEFVTDGATMTATYSNANTSNTMANDERLDAFFASVKDKTITGDVQMTVELTRPFAQINVGTSDFEIAKEMGAAPNRSYITVKNAYKQLDLVSGDVKDEEASPIQFAYGQIAGTTYDNNNKGAEAFPILGYDYLAMAYVLASQNHEVAEIEFAYVKDKDATTRVVRTVGSVPIQRNHRTNMFGQVLTSNASLNVIIVPEYEKPDYNYDQLLFAAAVGGTAVLDGDVEVPGELTFTKDAVVDLGGHEIKAEGGTNGDAVVVKSGANVTLKNGTIKESEKAASSNAAAVIYVSSATAATVTLDEMTLEGSRPIYVNSAATETTVTINSGNYTCTGTNGEVVYVQKGGKVVINGGTFSNPGATTYNTFLLNIKDDFRSTLNDPREAIEVFGGTFYGFNPANNEAEGPNTNFVAEGYKSVETPEGGNVWIVVPETTDIISVDSSDNFADVIANAADNAIFYLGEDVELKLPSKAVENKNFTFIGNGADKSNIINLNYENATGSNLTFENLTLQVAKGGSATSLGFNGAESIVLKNVTVKGEFHTFTATSAVFEGCHFVFDGVNTTDRQGIWCEAYGKTVITDCVFEVTPPEGNGNETKAILIYSDNNTVMGDVEITNCEFKGERKSAKAAVEIHSEKFTKAGTITITGCNYDKDIYDGGLWREIYNVKDTNHEKGDPTTFYTVIVDGETKQTGTTE